MSQPPVEYIRRITDNYAKLGYKAYQWVNNPDVRRGRRSRSRSRSASLD